jgi:hypothetical protein
MTDRNHIEDADERAAWELLGRHEGLEPSFGFAQRTLRRLHEPPAAQRRSWQLPVFRWAAALSFVVILSVSGWTAYQRVQLRRAETYAWAHEDKLEDFDVIASLDQLNGERKL